MSSCTVWQNLTTSSDEPATTSSVRSSTRKIVAEGSSNVSTYLQEYVGSQPTDSAMQTSHHTL